MEQMRKQARLVGMRCGMSVVPSTTQLDPRVASIQCRLPTRAQGLHMEFLHGWTHLRGIHHARFSQGEYTLEWGGDTQEQGIHDLGFILCHGALSVDRRVPPENNRKRQSSRGMQKHEQISLGCLPPRGDAQRLELMGVEQNSHKNSRQTTFTVARLIHDSRIELNRVVQLCT